MKRKREHWFWNSVLPLTGFVAVIAATIYVFVTGSVWDILGVIGGWGVVLHCLSK